MRPPSPLPDSAVLETSIRPDIHKAVHENLEADVRDLLRDAFTEPPSASLQLDTDGRANRSEIADCSPAQPSLTTPTTYTSAESEAPSQEVTPVFFTPLSSVRGSLSLGVSRGTRS